MSTVSQSIPNFLSGISQQPDSRKRPGQLKDAVNAFPDFALGMLKRPGGKFISKLHGATASGKWFEILRDSTEKYIAQYDDNVFRVWDLVTGNPVPVDMGSNTGVPGTCNVGTLKTETKDLKDARADVVTKLGLLQTAEAELAETVDQSKLTTNHLFELELEADALERVFPGKEYELNPFSQFLKTGVLKDSSGNLFHLINGTVEEEKTTNPSPHPAIHVTIKKAGSGFSAGTSNNQATATTGTGTGLKLNVTVDSTGCVTEVAIHGTDTGTKYFTGDVVTVSGFNGAEFEVHALGVGTERTNEYPLLASKGMKFYELMQTVAPSKSAADVTTKTNAYTTAKTNYDNAVTAEGNATTAYNNARNNCNISSIPATGYLNGATANDIEVLTLNDTTFVLNKKKDTAMSTLLNNRTAAQTIGGVTHPKQLDEHRAIVTITSALNSTDYTVKIDSTPKTVNKTSGATNNAIALDLANQLNTIGGGLSAIATGPSIYITKGSAFTVETSSGTASEALFAITTDTADVTKLPLFAKDGYVVRVVNSQDIDIDDMYLKFETEGIGNFGRGQWFETTAPNTKTKWDPLTMPHQLVRKFDSQSPPQPFFEFDPIDWDATGERLIGDDTTNKEPSYVGSPIDHLFFYRNRLGFLSGQNVILSKAGDLFDFWNTTAQTGTDDDPIDIAVAGKKPIFLHYVQPTSVGLVLYSANEQFILTTDSDILSPRSAKVNTMSNYECDPSIPAASLGISQAFISKTPLYTRLFELNDIATDTPPLMADITNYVPELIPSSVDDLKVSPGLSIVSLGEIGKTTLYQYRFLNRSRDQRVVNSWYKWDLTGTLLAQFFDASTYYAVVKNGSDVYVQSYDVAQSNEQGFLSLPTGEKTDVCLDLFDVNPHRTYTSGTDKTRIDLPYDAVTGSTLNVLVLGEYIGSTPSLTSQSVGAILTPTIAGSAGDQHVDIDGDYRGRNLIIGYRYDMTIDLPKIYRYQVTGDDVKNDDVSNLIIHRLKFKVGLSGPVDYKVSITGINPFTKDVTVTLPQQYNLNNVNMQASSTHVVPIYQRNENLAVQIIGNTPFPVSLLGLDWEGKLNQRFYRRG